MTRMCKNKRRVGIVATGLTTSVGRTASATAAAVRAGLSAYHIVPWRDRFGQPVKFAAAKYIPPELVGVDRMVALATLAIREAVALLPSSLIAQASVWLGVATARPDWPPEAAIEIPKRLAIEFDGVLAPERMKVLTAGHAAVLLGIQQATELIRQGAFDFALVGGVDSYQSSATLAWLDMERRLLSQANPDGFVPGEAAGFCLISAHDFAVRHGLEVMAEIEAFGTADEPYPFNSDGVCLAQGLTTAMRQALANCAADWTICDLNGESFRAQEWSYAYLRTARLHADPLEVWHPADCTGDVGAASGAVLAGIACAALSKGYGRGQRPLLWTSADHGPRACVLLSSQIRKGN
jgi:3-oxoacyl-[acyl-carrier-protein] synthase I